MLTPSGVTHLLHCAPDEIDARAEILGRLWASPKATARAHRADGRRSGRVAAAALRALV
jgi:hypothetical protein